MSSCSRAIEIHDEDRISDLPDCVMSNILSCLPTKEALRTYVLSREWKYKCTCIDDIDIDIDRLFKSLRWMFNILRFERFMNRILEFNQDVRISTFYLQTWNEYHDSRFTSIRVKHLSILVSSDQEKITLCRRLDNSMTELNVPLDRNIVVVDVENCFPNLKSLNLHGGRAGASIRIMNEKSPETVQLTFPVLKTFVLEGFEFLNVKFVEINAPEPTYFKASRLLKSNDCMIKICAPKLEKFVSVDCHLNKLVLRTPLLSDAVLKHQLVPSEIVAMQVITLLQGAPRLKDLYLSDSLVEALVKWKTIHNLSTFDRLRKLKLCGIGTAELMELLQGTPYIDSLHLLEFEENYERIQEPLPHCIVSQLKEVTFSYTRGSGLIYLTKLLLDKAKKLEKVYIYPCSVGITYDEFCYWRSTLGPEYSNSLNVAK